MVSHETARATIIAYSKCSIATERELSKPVTYWSGGPDR